MRRPGPLLLAAALLLALFLYEAGPGLGGTGDSAHYLAAARNLRATGHLTDLDGTPYRYWGPLYPALLALCFSPWAALVLHAAALLGSLGLWSRVGAQLLPAGRAGWLPVLLALSTAVLVPAKFIWAETVFGLLTAGYFWALLHWLRTDRAGWLGLATAAGFLLPLQRTSGFFLLAGAGAGLLATGIWRGRWGRLALHGLGCAVGGLAWNYYAEVLAGPPVYQAVGGWLKLGSSAADYGFVLGRWFCPLAAAWRAQWPVLWAAALPVGLALLWPAGREQTSPSLPASFGPSPKNLRRLLWWVLLVDVLAHLLATNLARGAAGPHDAERYLAALVGPTILLALARWPGPASRPWQLLKQAALLGWLGYSALRAGHNAQQLRRRPPVAWPGPATAPVTTSSAVARMAKETSIPSLMKPVFPLLVGALLLGRAATASAQTTISNGTIVSSDGTVVSNADGGSVTTSRPKTTTSRQAATAAPQTTSNAIIIGGNNSSRTIACDGDKISILGNNNNVVLTGNCARLSVAGNNNHVAAATVGSIKALGNNNAVTWSGPKPAVSNLGNGNTLSAK